ncbi:MAG: HD-GYP domain-containing protein [Actinomycetota bacterium]
MRTFYAWSVAVTAAVAIGAVSLLDDHRWEAPTLLFWLVVLAASGCAITALGVARLADRLGQAELGIVAAFFFPTSVLPLVHGLTTPGVLYGPNEVTMTSVFLTLPVSGLAALIVARAAAGPGYRWRRWLVATFAVVTVLAGVLLAMPDLRLYPTPGGPAAVVFAAAAFAGAVGLGSRHVQLAEIAGRPAPAVVAIGYLLVGASALVFLGASVWSTYFWLAHLADVTGVFLATIGAIVVYWRQGSVFAVLSPITALEPRGAFEYGLTPVVHRFVADLERKDRITRDHVVRTGALAIDVATALGLPPDEVRRCGLVGLLHDVGKLEIPDEVLTKPGRLTDEEFEIIKTHTVVGAELVAAAPPLADLAPAVRAHHERLDGTGYPDRLAGAAIPLTARIVAVCDSYDAMSFTRHYRSGMDPDKVRSILREHAGSQWDPQVVETLLGVIDGRADGAVWALDGIGRGAAAIPEGAGPGPGHRDSVPPIGCDCVPTTLVDAAG